MIKIKELKAEEGNIQMRETLLSGPSPEIAADIGCIVASFLRLVRSQDEEIYRMALIAIAASVMAVPDKEEKE